MTLIPRIRRQDFGVLTPPPLGGWTPSLTVTVVIPAHDRQSTLDLTLAALSAQTYPAGLMDVVVVDDGSPEPLRLPETVPGGTKLISGPPGGWGRAWALQAGLDAASGEVVLVLDADMVPHRAHVEAQLRWHHLAPYLVVLGWIDFTSAERLPRPEEVRAALLAGEEEGLFPLARERHDWAEKIIHDHDGLRAAPSSLATRIHVGATASYPAGLLRSIGGLDTSLVLAEDTELGYRLTQAGAVFVPDPLARAWHVGLPTAMRDFAALKRYNDPYVADRVPYRRYLRTDPGRQWRVPYVDAYVPSGTYEDVRASVDGLLGASLPDIRVTVAGPWTSLDEGRRSPLRDPDLDLRLIRAQFAHDPRVRLAPPPAWPARPFASGASEGSPGAAEGSPPVVPPFRLLVPPGWVPSQDAVERLVQRLEETDGGVLCLALDETEDGVVVARLERTAALSRAALVAEPGEHLDDVLDEVFGLEWLDGRAWGFARRPAVYPPRRRPAPEHVVQLAQRDKEILLLRKRATALRAELAEQRRLAGKATRDAARWRQKAEEWRRKAVTLSRSRERTVLRRAVRRVRGLTSPADT
ncbi:glycosyltransferase [Nonomuraea roseoviolacea]|uniref:Glycosyltransferase involved in cell wall biosynthesis n=1 Tax=Nonomuraea roseoviolacea subsp. carminata TaxID=160689 RepID=A0ABT1JUJ6_9ACTN|nr:glycosyltransferase [Nonomuraea roseoviolacea]MCP2345408.1 glycosyltransferase involved in cell wall biosynthesis [Nonomuraea roseoviolacea subsp. carminata]